MIIDRTAMVTAEFSRRGAAGLKIASNIAVATAIEKAPIREGFLRKGIFAGPVSQSGDEMRVRIIDSVEYADAQERGPAPGSKKKWKYTPHMRPMIDYMQGVFQGICERAVLGK